MAQYLSEDLRIRVIRAVEGGMSRNAAARHFGVSIASAVRWMDGYLRTGRTAPRRRGGNRRSGRIEAQADFLIAAIEERPDITLAELRERLVDERGETFAISTIHEFFRRHAPLPAAERNDGAFDPIIDRTMRPSSSLRKPGACKPHDW